MQLSKFIPPSLTRNFGRQLLTLKKNSPHIMFGAGVVGVITGTVLASRATLKVADVLDDIQKDVDLLTPYPNSDEAILGMKDIPEATDNRMGIALIYIRGTFEIVKLYAPAVIVTGAAIAALTGSHLSLTRRNAALTAAYTGMHEAYEKYRARVREEFGEEKELDIYHGVTVEKVKGEDGKIHEVKVIDPNSLSPYARIFDETSECWEKDPELNHLFVLCQQNWANDLLHARGHVFLNEVYDMLGIERSRAGQVVGWIMGHGGDEYVSFNIFEASNSRFVNGYEQSILLDFNVDGLIFDNFGKKED